MELKPFLIVVGICGLIQYGAYKLLSNGDNAAVRPSIEAVLLLETKMGVRAEYSLGRAKSMSDCRDMGAIEAAPDVDGYWIDPTFSKIGDSDSGWTYYLVTGFVCRP